MIEFFTQNIWLLWFFVSLICLIVEMAFGDLFLICFAIGALAASLMSAFGVDTIGQIIMFTIVSLLSILLVRPSMMKYLHRKENQRLSNVEAIIGRMGEVTQHIDKNGYGRVKLDGDDWKACSEDGNAIEKGEKVIIVAHESIILTVRKKNL
ncbi:MAG: NfeD family protein [Prevotellaceae bacterium]|nr:NfeD family protein [Prevotella sp.]MDD7530323.1 NfeD family protein [Prevotellaceae bacterium]MDY2633796.1 NfeD family protein [Prevotella sp.]